ncbi:hypothetical protein [Shewanella japonica]|uniref:hypothetical protein n=1 Tax=Shewanella japonica TaxID=93973 RepID=UPI000E70E373|nr:hypothetical protein [Shewanella japonica]
MRVSVSKNRNSLESGDEYFLLNRDAFYEHVDREDFECRKSTIIEATYHENWFEIDNAFLPPILFIKDGKVKFINGRHRTALLFSYLTEIPVIFLSPSASRFASATEVIENKSLIGKLVQSLKPDRLFEFPDLPVKNLG